MPDGRSRRSRSSSRSAGLPTSWLAGGQVGGPPSSVADRVAGRGPERSPATSSLRSRSDIHDRPRGPAQSCAHVPRQIDVTSRVARPRVRRRQNRGTSCASTRSTTRPIPGAGRPAGWTSRGVGSQPGRTSAVDRADGRPGGWPRPRPNSTSAPAIRTAFAAPIPSGTSGDDWIATYVGDLLEWSLKQCSPRLGRWYPDRATRVRIRHHGLPWRTGSSDALEQRAVAGVGDLG